MTENAEGVIPRPFATAVELISGLVIDLGRRGYLVLIVSAFLLGASAASIRVYVDHRTAENERYRGIVEHTLEAGVQPVEGAPQPSALVALVGELGYVDNKFTCMKAQPGACVRIHGFLQTTISEMQVAAEHPRPHSFAWCKATSDSNTHYGPALCDAGDTSFSIHQLAIDCSTSSPSPQQAYACLGARAQRAIAATANLQARSLEFLRRESSTSVDSDARPVQVYFVSPEGVVHLISLESRGPATGDFRGRFYVTASALGDVAHHELGPYIDVEGYGIVRTSCDAAQALDGTLFGVLCVDYFPPATDLTKRAGQELVEHGLVTVDRQRNVGVLATYLSPREEDRVRRALTGADPESLVQLHTVEAPDERKVMLVPLEKNQGRIRFAVIAPHAQTLGPLFWVMAAALLLTCVFVILGVAVRRLQFSVEDEFAVLRKLQAGVIQTDAGNRVIGANDRAEELLGQRLPPLGSREAGKRDFFEFFEEAKFWEVEVNGDRQLVRVTKEEVEKHRANGVASSYFVKRKDDYLGRPEKRRWLRVSGVPSLGARQMESFGMLNPASRKRQVELDKVEDGMTAKSGVA